MLSDNNILKESAFLVTNASGRHINLLNDNEIHEQQQQQQPIYAAPSPPSSEVSDDNNLNNSDSPFRISPPINTAAEEQHYSSGNNNKRKYHCTEPGCTKSFTTSGHLARHNRIHTGEKNFPCLFPGCQSRFSRQDNMMQHYRTHMSPKSRRTQKKIISEDLHPRPRLHAHQRIRSDPYRVERPLTIDQHLNNYRRSLLAHPSSLSQSSTINNTNSVKYNMPTPLGSVAQSHMQKQQQQKIIGGGNVWSVELVAHQQSSSHHEEEEEEEEEEMQQDEEEHYSSHGVHTPQQQHQSAIELSTQTAAVTTPEMLFYQHRPLTFSMEIKLSLPFTLLHPTRVPTPSPPIQQERHFDLQEIQQQETPSLSSSSSPSTTPTENTTTTSSSSQAGLLQLAHIVSTFG